MECYRLVNEKIKEFMPDAGEHGAVISLDQNYMNHNYTEIYSESRAANEDMFFSLYGVFFFLGIFLGVMFLMVTALIIYFKQISEGYDDKERFIIMQKVGMSNKEVKLSRIITDALQGETQESEYSMNEEQSGEQYKIAKADYEAFREKYSIKKD